MKNRYYITIAILIFLMILMIAEIKGYQFFSEWISSSATIGATFAALITGVMAVGVSDKPLRRIRFEVEAEVKKNQLQTYVEYGDLNISKRYPPGKVITSYRVMFRIKNVSGFTLNKPVVTFRLPKDLRHLMKNPSTGKLEKHEDGECILTFNTNLYNVRRDLRQYEYDNILVLSNNILPYLNDEQEHPVWIRMCLISEGNRTWMIEIDLNCDNAEGDTKKIKLSTVSFHDAPQNEHK